MLQLVRLEGLAGKFRDDSNDPSNALTPVPAPAPPA